MKHTIEGFGLNVDLHHLDKPSLEKALLAILKLKARWVRLEIDLDKYVDPKKLQALAYFCGRCRNNKIEIVGLITHFVPGTLRHIFFSDFFRASVLERTPIIMKEVQTIVKTLSESVRHWEIWNEQNSKRFWIRPPSPREYVTFLTKINKTIKKIQPKGRIIFGGVNGNDVTPMVPMPRHYFYYTSSIEHAFALGADEFVDFVAFHPYVLSCYVSFHNPNHIAKEIIDRIDETRSKYPRVPLLISEIGVSPVLNPKLRPDDISMIYTMIIDHCKRTDIPVSFYTLADHDPAHFGSLNPDRDFGFLDYHLNEKPLLQSFLKTYL